MNTVFFSIFLAVFLMRMSSNVEALSSHSFDTSASLSSRAKSNSHFPTIEVSPWVSSALLLGETTSFPLVLSTETMGSMRHAHQAVATQDKSLHKKNTGLPFHRLAVVAKVGSMDLKRMAHSTFGVASLLIGGAHAAQCITQGFDASILSPTDALGLGIIHTITAAFGVTRLDMDNPKEAARNAMIWPVPIQNAWIVAATQSEIVLGKDAVVSLYSEPMMAFTMLYLSLLLFQTAKSFRGGGETEHERHQSGIWFPNKWANLAITIVSYTLIFGTHGVEVAYLHSNVEPTVLNDFVASYPDDATLMGNVLMSDMWFNNLAVFLATLLRYKALDTVQIRAFYLPLLAAVAAGTMHSFLSADGGTGAMATLNLFGLAV